ncbi:hypothetical protein [Treponema denticola]|uniref:hypothetical protein n=1 Tax=Treponema denticola TaxID=158 RepID=UPI0021062B50|nr:hypothetical protein [Treponema denticola]
MKIEYIENPIYDKTNNIYSLYLACNEMAKDDTILLESDLIFKPALIKDIIENNDKNIAVVSPFEAWMDGTCTVLDQDNYIINILDKAQFNWNDINHYFKTVNIYNFQKNSVRNIIFHFLKHIKKPLEKMSIMNKY